MFPSKITKAALAGATALALATVAAPSQSLADFEPHLGDIQFAGYNYNPRGWTLCNGQLFPIASWTALFSLLGTTYGGDGRTTFGIPDMRGRVPIHVGRGPGLSSYSWGQKGGQETVSLTVVEMPSHNHTLKATAERGDTDVPGGAIAQDRREDQFTKAAAPNVAMNASSVGNTGGSQAHENRSPFLVINCSIAIVGAYPSRS